MSYVYQGCADSRLTLLDRVCKSLILLDGERKYLTDTDFRTIIQTRATLNVAKEPLRLLSGVTQTKRKGSLKRSFIRMKDEVLS